MMSVGIYYGKGVLKIKKNVSSCPKIVRHRMTRTLATFAVLALAITGASASALYSTTPQVDGKVYIEGTCSKVSASPRFVFCEAP